MAVSKEEKDRIDLAIAAGAMAMAAKKAKADRRDAPGAGSRAGDGKPGRKLKRRWRAAGRPAPLRAWAEKEGLRKVDGAWTKV